MKKTKLKNRIWITSLGISLAFWIIIIHDPTTLLLTLPIIIPTSTLAISLPLTSIIKNKKQSPNKQPVIKETNKMKIYNNKNNNKSKNNNKEKTDIIDDIINDPSISLETKKEILTALKEEWSQDNSKPYQKNKKIN